MPYQITCKPGCGCPSTTPQDYECDWDTGVISRYRLGKVRQWWHRRWCSSWRKQHENQGKAETRKVQLSPLEHVNDMFWRGMHVCARCGNDKETWPKYNEHRSANLEGIGLSPVCEACWGELTPEGRFQWVLLLMASWAEQYREKPITYDPPHFQARYRDWALILEGARRALFEPPVLGWPQLGPSRIGYRACYLHPNEHDLIPIEKLELQICAICRGWFDMQGDGVQAWEALGIPEGARESERIDECIEMTKASGPHYCPYSKEHGQIEMDVEASGSLRCPKCGCVSGGGMSMRMEPA